MPVTVRQISLWRKEAENKIGLLAHTLEPLAKAGADLSVVMGYRLPGDPAKAVIEVYPVSGKVTAAATETGLAASATPTLLVEGDNKPGLGTKLHRQLRTLEATSAFSLPKQWAEDIPQSSASQTKTMPKRRRH